MTQEQMGESHRFAQSEKIVGDSRIAKVDSLLTAFAQNDEFIDSPNLSPQDESTPNTPKIDYIIFLDSDDFWEVDLLEKCVDSALKHNAQIVWFSWKTFYDGIDNPSVNGGGNPLGLAFMATRKRAS